MRRGLAALLCAGAAAAFAGVVACDAIIGTRDVSLEGGDGGPGAGTDSSTGGPGTDSGMNGDGSPGTDGGPCGNTSFDPHNCGACGFDCSNGTCTNGICTLIDNGFMAALGIALDATNVYFTEIGSLTGGVLMCPQNGCEAAGATRLTSTNENQFYQAPSSLIFSGGYLFYANDYTSSSPSSVPGLYRLLPDGGALTRLQTNDANALWVGLGDGMLAWTTSETDAGVHACAAPDCAAPVIIPNGPNPPDTVTVSAGGKIIWGSGGGTFGVYMCNDTACTGGAKLVTTTSDFVTGVAVDTQNIYFSTLTTVASCPLSAPCGTPTIIASGEVNVQTLIVSGTSLYWAAGGTNNADPTDDGAVRKCATVGCTTPVSIATGEASPAGLAADATAIYWTDFGELASTGTVGALKKAPR